MKMNLTSSWIATETIQDLISAKLPLYAGTELAIAMTGDAGDVAEERAVYVRIRIAPVMTV